MFQFLIENGCSLSNQVQFPVYMILILINFDKRNNANEDFQLFKCDVAG